MTWGFRSAGLAIAVVAASLFAAPASAFTPEQEAELQAVVDDYRTTLGYPGMVVGVWREGEGGFTTATGVSDIDTGRPMRLGDHFRIGSETKTMTATLILQLQQRGKLRLNDPVSEYVRGVPLGGLIKIRMLLNHTSGIHDGPSKRVNDALLQDLSVGFTPRQLIRGPVRAPRYGLPGEVWTYSNTNFWLLGLIVRRLTDKPLRRLYRERIFERVGMDETSFRDTEPPPIPRAQGYVGGAGGAPLDVTEMNWSWAWTAGGVSSTLEDLRRWAPALTTGKGLLSRATQIKRIRHTIAMGKSGLFAGTRYGLGIFTWPLPSGIFYGHDGEGPGYDSVTMYEPESKTTIVALGNTSAEQDPVHPSALDDELGIEGIVPRLAAVAAG